jgi:SagB-type dehydrogenase family enzyme
MRTLIERLALRPGVSAVTDPDGETTLVVANRGERFGRLADSERTLLRRLAIGTYICGEVRLVARLRRGGWLSRTLEHEGRRLVTVRPLAAQGDPRPAEPVAVPRLSRFAVIRPDGAGLVLESPLARVAVHLHDPEVITLLHNPKPVHGYQRELLDELAGYGFVVEAGGEDRDLETHQWSHHDLWFHARSRFGRHDEPAGGTYRAKGLFDAPRRAYPLPEHAIDLPRPTQPLADKPFSVVLESRRSIRNHDPEHPLTADQLGEFLYRCARVRWAGDSGGQETFDRPYPSGGRLHPLELYAVVSAVTGIPPGMYRYEGRVHRLDRVPAPERPVQRIVRQAMASAAADTPPQVLIVIAARFGAAMWKYEGIGYALLLKEVGVLLQTMYLVATAMDLAPCALGTGDTELFAQATGLPYLAESSVGEFALGTPAR